jgi:hypothetical protein
MTSGRLVEGRCRACGADVPESAVSADFGPLEAYTASHAEDHEVTVPGFEYAKCLSCGKLLTRRNSEPRPEWWDVRNASPAI